MSLLLDQVLLTVTTMSPNQRILLAETNTYRNFWNKNKHGESCLCKYLSGPNNTAAAIATEKIVMTTTAGYGRTGNVVRAVYRAMRRGHQCKTIVQLPMDDKKSHILFPPANSTVFDFSTRPGERHPACHDASIGIGLSGDTKTFFKIEGLPNVSAAEISFFDAYSGESNEIDICLRVYLGICDRQFCEGFRSSENSLVAHIRQDDIFPSNRSAHVNYLYGQPPLSYYLSAIHHQPWEEIIVVAQNTTYTNPVWLQLKLLNNLGVLKMPIKFVSSDWDSDLRLLMCAPNLVESRSTMHLMLRLGFAQRYYAPLCFHHALKSSAVYAIQTIGGYEPYTSHDNSEKEWLDMLQHDVLPIQECDRSAPDYYSRSILPVSYKLQVTKKFKVHAKKHKAT